MEQKESRRNFWFYAIYGLTVPGITFITSLFIAYNFGAIIRGEFAFAFAIMNLLIAILSGPESGSIRINASQSLPNTTDQRIVYLTFRNILASYVILIPLHFTFNNTLPNFNYLAISAGICSGLVVKANQLLSQGKRIESILLTSALWVIFLGLMCILSVQKREQVDIDDVLLQFLFATLITSILIFKSIKNFSKFSTKSSVERKARSFLGLSTVSTIAQLNGLIIVLQPFVTPRELGVIALGISFLNGALSSSISVINGKTWEKDPFRKFPSISLWLVPTSLFLFFGFLTQSVLGSEFEGVASIICLLLPFYFTFYLTEFYIVKNYSNSTYQLYIKVKFSMIITTLSLILVYGLVSQITSFKVISIFGANYLSLSIIVIGVIQRESLSKFRAWFS